MASARRTGTNESISTYGSGQTYTVLNTWEADTDNDNVATKTSPVLECLAASYDDTVTLGISTNSATYFRIIRPQQGSFHTGIRDTGVRFYYTGDNHVLLLNETDSQIQDVCARTTANSANDSYALLTTGTTTRAAFVGCIATASTNAGSGANNGAIALSDMLLVDCISEGNENFQFLNQGASVTGYNCTFIGPSSGGLVYLNNVLGLSVLKNCLSQGNGSQAFFNVSTSITMTNCASDDATATGTNPRINQTFTFVNAGAQNYHLAINDAGAKDFGVDLSADATFPFNDDIDRKVIFSAWPIGFDDPNVRKFILSHP